jgi:hypothetical protein
MPGSAVSVANVIARFNATVMANVAPNRGAATWHIGAFPWSDIRDPQRLDHLGNVAEPDKTVANYTAVGGEAQGAMASSVVFNILHQFAMELTRVRQARIIYFQTNGYTPSLTHATALTALNPNLAIAFPIPHQPVPGESIDDTIFGTFLANLVNRVNAIRSDATHYQHTFVACHSSCHSSCHGSRGRR